MTYAVFFFIGAKFSYLATDQEREAPSRKREYSREPPQASKRPPTTKVRTIALQCDHPYAKKPKSTVRWHHCS